MLVSLYIIKTHPCNIQIFFSGIKNVKFCLKKRDAFNSLAQNIDGGYMLELPRVNVGLMTWVNVG